MRRGTRRRRNLAPALLLSAAIPWLAGCKPGSAPPPAPQSAPDAVQCEPAQGWKQGLAGVALDTRCAEHAGYVEAFTLGEELHTLRARRALLAEQIASTAPSDRSAQLQRQRRQLEVDIEALEGLAVVNRWQ